MDIRIGVLNNIVWKHNFETKKAQIDGTLAGNRPGTAVNEDLYNIIEAQDDMDDLNS